MTAKATIIRLMLNAKNLANWLSGQTSREVEGPFREVSVGSGVGCGLLEDGTMRCWRHLGYGRELEPLAGEFKSLSVTTNYVCGLRLDGIVECLGSEEGRNARELEVFEPPDVAFRSLSVARRYACGVVENSRRVLCWGDTWNIPTADWYW